MNIIKKLTSWWIFISITSSAVVAQDLTGTLHLAKVSLEQKRFDDAEHLYRRVIYFDSLGQHNAETIGGMAKLSYATGNYDEASRYFLTLNRITKNPTDYYFHILSLIRDQNWVLAQKAALNMPDTSDAVTVSKHIFMGLSTFGKKDFQASASHFEEAEAELGMAFDQERIFSRVAKVDKKNRTKAIVLSAFLPGLGQAYSGHFGEAANSFLLISAVGLVYYYSLTQIGFLDALITISPWLNRYYVGGMNKAAELVDDYKEEQFLLLYNELVTLFGDHIR